MIALKQNVFDLLCRGSNAGDNCEHVPFLAMTRALYAIVRQFKSRRQRANAILFNKGNVKRFLKFTVKVKRSSLYELLIETISDAS